MAEVLRPDAIQLKRGPLGERTSMPALLEGELGFKTDTGELFIGTATGNLLINVLTAGGVKITAQTALASAPVGTIFEDTDGVLKYKNLAGIAKALVFDDTAIYDALDLKQDKTDAALNTTSKTVVGAINELEASI